MVSEAATRLILQGRLTGFEVLTERSGLIFLTIAGGLWPPFCALPASFFVAHAFTAARSQCLHIFQKWARICRTLLVQEALPEDPPWWEVFSVDLADMCMVCREIFKLYHMEKAVYVNLGKKPGALPDTNASPAPAQLTPAISAGQSGGDAAEHGSQGPSPEIAPDGKVKILCDPYALDPCACCTQGC